MQKESTIMLTNKKNTINYFHLSDSSIHTIIQTILKMIKKLYLQELSKEIASDLDSSTKLARVLILQNLYK